MTGNFGMSTLKQESPVWRDHHNHIPTIYISPQEGVFKVAQLRHERLLKMLQVLLQQASSRNIVR